jgi:hypothetical protein
MVTSAVRADVCVDVNTAISTIIIAVSTVGLIVAETI